MDVDVIVDWPLRCRLLYDEIHSGLNCLVHMYHTVACSNIDVCYCRV